MSELITYSEKVSPENKIALKELVAKKKELLGDGAQANDSITWIINLAKENLAMEDCLPEIAPKYEAFKNALEALNANVAAIIADTKLIEERVEGAQKNKIVSLVGECNAVKDELKNVSQDYEKQIRELEAEKTSLSNQLVEALSCNNDLMGRFEKLEQECISLRSEKKDYAELVAVINKLNDSKALEANYIAE